MYDIREYYRAGNVAEAVKLLEMHPGTHVISGGTDVLVSLRHLEEKYCKLVDIHGLDELKQCSLEKDGTLRLGSGLSFTNTIECALVKKYIPVLGEACATVAGPQVRNMGTIGGNIANGATSADTAAPMLVLEPELIIAGPKGERRIPIQGFHTGPGKVALEPAEVLVAFEFKKKNYEGLGASYYKYAMRSAMDIATIACAAGVRMKDGKLSELRLAYGVAAPTPVRCHTAEEAAKGKTLEDGIQAALAVLESDIKPRTSWRATKEFRVRIIRTLAERMIRDAASKAGGRA